MIELRIAFNDLQALRSSLLGQECERCAVLLAARARDDDGRELMLVRETILAAGNDYTDSGFDHAQLRPDFVARVAKRARLQKLALIFVHTHPGSHPPHFSPVDDRGETELVAFLERRGQIGPHAALVLSEGGVSARKLGPGAPIKVVGVGEKRVVEFDPDVELGSALDMYDRQIRAFGEDGQRVLKSLNVAIVGLGGTGSIAAQQLVHLGVRKFILIDPDYLERTNLNRVVGAHPADVGRSKVEIAARALEALATDVSVSPIVGDVVHASVARRLVNADVIFCCTDSHGSRSVVQQVAYQFLLPCIDIGSTITTQTGEVTGIFGRVQLLGPDQPCLWCSELLNPDEVRRDMMNDFERKADPYIRDAHEPAPSVISLNGTVVSLAITMLLGLVTPIPVTARHLIYNARTSSLRSVSAAAKHDCFICSRAGAYGRGDAMKLFARQD